MGPQFARYVAERPPGVAEDWTLERLTPPSRLHGANGLRTGPDGRIYVAQLAGSQISAVDPETGAAEAISPHGGDIVAPDDLVFDAAGNLYATEITEDRVGVRAPNGATRVLCGDIFSANPITMHQGRLFAGECRFEGRIMELDLNGGAPRILLENIPLPNAFEVGPDGMLYFPVMGANEIWRVSLDGGAPERVVGDLGTPDAVKFDPQGRIVSTQLRSGQVLRIDPRTGARETLADITPGIDNLTFVGERIFVSSNAGLIVEVLAGGALRTVAPAGLIGPLGLAMGGDGRLFIADGPKAYYLTPGGAPEATGGHAPGYCRGVATSGPGEVVVTTPSGQVFRWRPALQESERLAEGFDQLYGVAVAPGGAVIVAESGAGRVLSLGAGAAEVLGSGLQKPTGLAVGPDGTVYVAETGAGRVVKLYRGEAVTVLDGLDLPQGLVVRDDGRLYVVDAQAKDLIEFDPATGARRVIAGGLPVGAPPGVIAKPLKSIGGLLGPLGPFAGLAAGPDGALYVAADADGSILALRPA